MPAALPTLRDIGGLERHQIACPQGIQDLLEDDSAESAAPGGHGWHTRRGPIWGFVCEPHGDVKLDQIHCAGWRTGPTSYKTSID